MDDYDKERQKAQRDQRKRLRLEPNPTCTVCGLSSVPALVGMPFSRLPRKLQRKLVEEHHLAGRKAGHWTVPVCRNCHAMLSDAQYDWDPQAQRPGTQQQRLAAFLQGLADWCRALGHALLSIAEALQAWVRQLLDGPTGEGPP